ncbi:MAG: ribonuclease HII [Candidatus Omnitrophica bacterium]|nr:ribonuclease HII [Candidatus Omnitrophota bacterium]
MLLYEKRASRKSYKLIAGIDEAGRGPLAGPVVAACVILGKRVFRARIDDSKKLSPPARERAFAEISRSCLVSVGIVDHEAIDNINILRATLLAMRESVLGMGVRPDYLLIDGNMKLRVPIAQECVVGGDGRSLSIAAASIVAKFVRDAIMLKFDKSYPVYGFSFHKGYGTKKHMRALGNFGPCPIHRRSFEPVKTRITT